MRIRSRILLTQIGVGLVVALMAFLGWVAFSQAGRALDRIMIARMQLEAIAEVAEHANAYNEQLAEFLLIGPDEANELEDARLRFGLSLGRLEEATRREQEFLAGTPEAAGEVVEAGRLQRIRMVTAALDRAGERIVELRGSDFGQALRFYRSDIENDFDRELEVLIGEAIADERGEVAQVDAATRRSWTRLSIVALAAAAAAVLLSVGVAAGLNRELSRPLSALIEGAARLGRGARGVRVPQGGPYEIALLAARFNEMAGELDRRQHDLRASNAALEARVAQRTAELDHANARLRQLDSARVRFLSDISHELRTPLTVILGETGVALRRQDNRPEERYRDALVRIADVGEDMSRLVEDLLFLARSEGGSVPFVAEPVDLGAVMALALEQCRTLAARQGVVLAEHPAAATIEVAGDAQRLKQVALILLDNAVKYTDAGGTVRVRLAARGGHAELRVRNPGRGIAPAELPYVFERFYRGQGAKSRGSGLGLPIAKWIVERHGGDIGIRSEVDGLTEVTVRLPRTQALAALIEQDAGA